MNCVVVCVVLLVSGNVDSFGVNRTSTDFEKTLEEVFGPPIDIQNKFKDTDSESVSENPTTEQSDLDKAIRDLYGSPVISNPERFLTMTNVDTKTSTTEREEIISQLVLDEIFGSAISSAEPGGVGGEKDTGRRIKDKDVDAVLGSSPEPTTVYEDFSDYNNTESNVTDRFLTEDLINRAYDNNIQEDVKLNDPVQRHLRIPIQHTKPREERNLTPNDLHNIITSTEYNAAIKSDASSLIVFIVLYIVCTSIFFPL